jgi:hypothetical protein
MPITKIKSKEYLEFLSTKKCPITGAVGIHIHHESLLREFSAGLKNHNDFQAIPLDKNLHLQDRHSFGKEKFWAKYKKNPYEIAIQFLSEYIMTAPSDAESAIFYLNRLKEQKDRWNFSAAPRYKKL